MTKDVLISVSGMQFGPDVAGEKVEVITKGNYYKKKNKHYPRPLRSRYFSGFRHDP